jgi:hypothetical protein
MGAITPPAPATPPYLEQYKAYLVDLGNIGTRYATSNGFYLSVVTALLGILALTKAGEAFVGSQEYLAVIVPIFAIMVCWIWLKTIAYYSNLFAAKFKVMRKLETEGQLFHIYELEQQAIDERRPPHSMLENDRRIPILLMGLFSIVLAYMLFYLGFQLLCKANR